MRNSLIIHGDFHAVQIEVELSLTEEQRRKGLMFREYLPEDRGMLFVLDEDSLHPLWMKNTCIPLDLVFLRDDRVVDLIENAAPHSEERLFSSVPYRMALEVNAGWVKKHRVHKDDRFEII